MWSDSYNITYHMALIYNLSKYSKTMEVDMDKRRLGKTGHMSTILTLGGAALGTVTQAEADAAIAMAIEHGINRGMILGLGCGNVPMTKRTDYPEQAYRMGRELQANNT
jgi:hypothetical protein